jgi:uncharacterized FlaG/YvyC family protein
MGQVTVTALRAVNIPEQPNGIATQAERAQTKAVASAVQVLNQAGVAGDGREVTFSKDSETKRLVIHVVDKESGKVIVQWPSAYALEMAQDYQKEHPTNESLL